jgi:hypothetical protein
MWHQWPAQILPIMHVSIAQRSIAMSLGWEARFDDDQRYSVLDSLCMRRTKT